MHKANNMFMLILMGVHIQFEALLKVLLGIERHCIKNILLRIIESPQCFRAMKSLVNLVLDILHSENLLYQKLN